MAISIPILSEFSPKGIERAVREFKRLETAGQKAQFVINKAAVPAAAALAGLAAAAGLSVRAAIQDQRSQVELARTLRATMRATDDQVAAVERQIAAMEAATGVADDQLRPAFAALVRGTGDFAKAQEGLALALDISAATGRQVEEVTQALSMAYGGNMRGLRQLSPEVFKLIKDGASLDEVFKALSATFGGAMAENANTVEGRLRRLSVAVDNVQENIGYALLPVLEAVLPSLQRFGDWALRNEKGMVRIGAAIAGVAAAILAMKVVVTINAFLVVFGTSLAALAGPLALATAGVVGLKLAFDGLEDSATFGEKGIVNFGNVLRRFATGPLGLAVLSLEGLQAALSGATGGGAASGTRDQGLRHLGELQSQIGRTTVALGGLENAQDKTFGGGAASKVESYSQRFKSALEDALSSARDRLQDASQEMTRFSESVRESLLGAFGFREALEAGEETGGGFLAGLRAQAAEVLEYSRQVRQLLDMGLSRDALSEVLAAGNEAGSQIAKELIAGGASAIEATNDLVASAQLAADEVGVLAGEKYFGAGVVFAQNVVSGLEAELAKLTPKLMARMDEIARRLRRTVDVDVRINEIVNRVNVTAGGIPALAEGGIVTRPTLALIGEAGPEAVVPLSRMGQGGGAGGDTTINIYSTIADESLPEKLVQALRTYNRTTGPVRIQVI